MELHDAVEPCFDDVVAGLRAKRVIEQKLLGDLVTCKELRGAKAAVQKLMVALENKVKRNSLNHEEKLKLTCEVFRSQESDDLSELANFIIPAIGKPNIHPK